MVDKIRFSFTEIDSELGALSTLPYLPLILTYQNQSPNVSGLLDTGSSVNVLPYKVGLRLGAVWERQRLCVPLGGNLARYNVLEEQVLSQIDCSYLSLVILNQS